MGLGWEVQRLPTEKGARTGRSHLAVSRGKCTLWCGLSSLPKRCAGWKACTIHERLPLSSDIPARAKIVCFTRMHAAEERPRGTQAERCGGHRSWCGPAAFAP